MLTLVLGGARSGKSTYAQSLCGRGPVVYLATATAADDEEMQRRIDRHRQSRPSDWTTVEAPLDLPAAVDSVAQDATVLVDCITVWISNLLWTWRDLEASALQDRVLECVDDLSVAARQRQMIAVSNEVGSGVVPSHPVARLFRDVQGLANQRLARAAERVVLVTAGIPLVLKSEGRE